jgi:hypothetical protein
MEATDAAWKRVACRIEGKVGLWLYTSSIKSHTWSWSYSSWCSINEYKSGSSTGGTKPSSRDRCSRPFKGNVDRILLRNHNLSFMGLAWVSWSKEKTIITGEESECCCEEIELSPHYLFKKLDCGWVGWGKRVNVSNVCCPTKLFPESWLDVRIPQLACRWRCRTGFVAKTIWSQSRRPKLRLNIYISKTTKYSTSCIFRNQSQYGGATSSDV